LKSEAEALISNHNDDTPMLTPEPTVSERLEILAVDNEKTFRLFNVLSGEMWELHPDCMRCEAAATSGLDRAVDLLIRYYYRKRYQQDDKAFLQRINGVEEVLVDLIPIPFPLSKNNFNFDMVDLTTIISPQKIKLERKSCCSSTEDSKYVDFGDDDFFDLPLKPNKILKLEGNLSSDDVSQAVFALANKNEITSSTTSSNKWTPTKLHWL